MQRRALAFKEHLKKHPLLKRENMDPRVWLKNEHVKGFTEFLVQKDPEEDTSYNNVEMLLESEREYIEAAKRNDINAMMLLGKGVNVNAKNVHNRTALHYATAHGNVEAVQLLLKRRARLDLQDKHGLTAIHLAAWFGSLDILQLLVQHGGDQSVETNDGMNIIHCAAINNHTDIVAYIVNDLQMKELDKEDQHGNRAFALASMHGCVQMLQMLMEEPYSMATMEENQEGDTPLHLAARNGHVDALQLLLENFDLRDEVNQAGQTALYLAADGAHEECIQVLFEAGCDPNILTLTNCSPLHPVCERGHTDIVRLLIQGGTQMNVQNQHFHSPLYLAVKNCHIPVIHTLLQSGCDSSITDNLEQTVLHLAAEQSKVDVVEIILKAGIDLEITDKHGKTALAVASRADVVIIVDMIIKAERYYSWRRANADLNESLHDESPLTFKLDHRSETREIRSVLWSLAYQSFKRNDWKRLALHWGFTEPQLAALEEQWTGPKSYQEHGNRMLLIWLHGVIMAQKNAARELYEGLVATGYAKAAEKIRAKASDHHSRICTVS